MPSKTIYLTALATTDATNGGYRQLDSSISGTVEVLLHAGAECQLVTEKANGADALTAASANGRFNITGSVTTPVRLRLNPSTSWIRSNSASSTTVYAFLDW